MNPDDNLAQKDGETKSTPVSDYTKAPPAYSQPQVPNKTPLHSRTQNYR